MRDKIANIWKHFRPSIISLIIPGSYVALVLIFLGSSVEQWKTLTLSILLLLLWFFLSYLLFPRIVVTIDNRDICRKIKFIKVLADGKMVYKIDRNIELPIQFSFQVWRRAKYDLCLRVRVKEDRKFEPTFGIKVANTYEHTICHVRFYDKNDTQKDES